MKRHSLLKTMIALSALPLASCGGNMAEAGANTYQIDGLLGDSCYNDDVANCLIEFGSATNPHFVLSGCRVSGGAYFLCTIYCGSNTMSSADWYKNANIEFRFGETYLDRGSPQRYIYFQGPGFSNPKASSGIDIAFISSQKETSGPYAGLYKTIVEFFVPSNQFLGYTESSPEFRFYIYGYVWNNSSFVGYMNGDYWAQVPDYYYSYLAVTRNGIYWY